jgi:threonine/homoserine/homoserine lactone efflux protein
MNTDRKMPILIWGFIVSFLGSLPPGTTNVLMIQLTATRGYIISTWFASGCMLAEIVCVTVCVLVMDRISQSKRLTRSLEWLSLIVIVWLIVATFTRGNIVIPQLMSPFVFGFVLMILNPVQLPFWLGWTTILAQRKILVPAKHNNVLYATGIALGSLAASALFIAGGHLIAGWISGKEKMIQWVFGSIFIIIAAIQLWKIFRPSAAYQEQGR